MDVSSLTWPSARPRSGRVELREYRSSDIAMVQDLATDPYLPLIGTLPAFADRAQATEYINRQQTRLTEGAGFSFVIADAESDKALGGVGLWLRAAEEGRASIGYCVAPGSRGRHAASEALSAVTEFAWTLPELFRLEALIELENQASLRTAERAGFTREGVLRSYMTIGAARRDMAVYSLLRGE